MVRKGRRGTTMKLQVCEQFEGGHHTNYIEALLPELAHLVLTKRVGEVIITVTERHFTSLKNMGVATRFADCIHFDPAIPEASPNPTLFERRQITANLLQALERHRPDYLISTSADYESLFLAVRRFMGLRALPAAVASVGMFHCGYLGAEGPSSADRLKQRIYSFSWRYADYSRLLMVNPLVYEALINSDGSLRDRVGLLPDPVPPADEQDRKKARKRLQLPEVGTVIGFVGTMDRRKAIPELLAAFRAAAPRQDERLLLAGGLDPAYRALVEEEYEDLLSKDHLVVLDKYLTPEELSCGHAALDVAAILQYRRPNLSANLLKAVVAHRPVLVDRFGYTGMMAERFGIGWTVDLGDRRALALTMRTALDTCGDYRVGERTKRLIEFHSPENYAKSVIHSLAGLAPAGYSPELKTWDWVCGE